MKASEKWDQTTTTMTEIELQHVCAKSHFMLFTSELYLNCVLFRKGINYKLKNLSKRMTLLIESAKLYVLIENETHYLIEISVVVENEFAITNPNAE